MKTKFIASILMFTAAVCDLAAQTQLDLRTQTKTGSADFSSLGATKPAQTGSSLPASCNVGQVFFLTTAQPGSNLMVCASLNQWTATSGALNAQANGTNAGSTSLLNFVPGTYVTQTITCSNGACSYQPDVDTTRVPVNSEIQSGQLLTVLTTSSSSTAYTGVMSANDPLASYTANQQLLWNVGATPCSGGAMSLNIDGLGAVPLKESDGVTNLTSPQCAANAQLILTYDAANLVFRLQSGSQSGGADAASVHSLSFSPALVFTGTSQTAGTIDVFTPGTLTGSVTSSTCSGFTPGQKAVFIFTQDATGGRTVAGCAGWDAFLVQAPANAVSVLSYTVDASGNGHLDNPISAGANTFTGQQSAPAFVGTGSDAFLNFPSNTGHSYSSGDIVNNGGTLAFNNGVATVHLAQVVASGTSPVTATAVAPGTCSAAITVSAANVAATDVMISTVNGDPTTTTGYTPSSTGSLYIWSWPSAGNVNFKVCNNTASSITPGTIALNWSVTR